MLFVVMVLQRLTRSTNDEQQILDLCLVMEVSCCDIAVEDKMHVCVNVNVNVKEE